MAYCSILLVSEEAFTVRKTDEFSTPHPRFLYEVGPIKPEVLRTQRNGTNDIYINSLIQYVDRVQEQQQRQAGRGRERGRGVREPLTTVGLPPINYHNLFQTTYQTARTSSKPLPKEDQTQWLKVFAEIKDDKITHSVWLSRDFVKEMCAIFPTAQYDEGEKPWSKYKLQLRLQGTFQIEPSLRWYPLVKTKQLPFEKRFNLTETFWNFQDTGNQSLTHVLDDSITCQLMNPDALLSILGNLEGRSNSRIEISLDWFQDNLFEAKNPASVMSQMFDQETSKDFTLASGNGVEVKCHKSILMSQSEVMAAMLAPGREEMMEQQTGKLEMEEMGDEELKQFVRLLYGQNVIVSKMTCEEALAIFKYCHLYAMNGLLESLTTILLQGNHTWYSPDVLVELYILLKRTDFSEDLRKYLLRCMTKMKDETRNCETYKELNSEDREDLVWSLVSV